MGAPWVQYAPVAHGAVHLPTPPIGKTLLSMMYCINFPGQGKKNHTNLQGQALGDSFIRGG